MQDKPPLSYGVGFRSLAREIPEPVALTVSGALPSWLKGTLLRTGPSKFEVGARTYNHRFDGLAMLHQFAFADGSGRPIRTSVPGETLARLAARGDGQPVPDF